jgi:hypothetical protein
LGLQGGAFALPGGGRFGLCRSLLGSFLFPIHPWGRGIVGVYPSRTALQFGGIVGHLGEHFGAIVRLVWALVAIGGVAVFGLVKGVGVVHGAHHGAVFLSCVFLGAVLVFLL